MLLKLLLDEIEIFVDWFPISITHLDRFNLSQFINIIYDLVSSSLVSDNNEERAIKSQA